MTRVCVCPHSPSVLCSVACSGANVSESGKRCEACAKGKKPNKHLSSCEECPLGTVPTADRVGCTPRTTVFGKDVDCAPAFGFTRTRDWALKPRNDTRCDSLDCVSCSNGTNIEVKQGWRLHMAGNTAAVLRCPNRDACEQRYRPGRIWRRKHALDVYENDA